MVSGKVDSEKFFGKLPLSVNIHFSLSRSFP